MPGILIGILLGLVCIATMVWICFGIDNHFAEASRRDRAEEITKELTEAEEQFLYWAQLLKYRSLSVEVFLGSASTARITGERRAALRRVLNDVVRLDKDKALAEFAYQMLDTMPFFGESFRNLNDTEAAVKYCYDVITWCHNSSATLTRLTRDKQFRRQWLADRTAQGVGNA